MEQKVVDELVDFFCDVLLDSGHDALYVANPHDVLHHLMTDDNFKHDDADGPKVTLQSFSMVIGNLLALEQRVRHHVVKLNSIWAVLDDSI